jgi:hypothetical protein
VLANSSLNASIGWIGNEQRQEQHQEVSGNSRHSTPAISYNNSSGDRHEELLQEAKMTQMPDLAAGPDQDGNHLDSDSESALLGVLGKGKLWRVQVKVNMT